MEYRISDEQSQAAAIAECFDNIGRVTGFYYDDFGWDVRLAREGDKLPIVQWSMKNAPDRLSPNALFWHWQTQESALAEVFALYRTAVEAALSSSSN